jgi:hypothetical protein
MFMFVLLVMFVPMLMLVVVPMVSVIMSMLMFVIVRVRMSVASLGCMPMFVAQMHLKLHASYGFLAAASNVEMVLIQSQFLELVLKSVAIHSQIKQRSDEHIAANATEDIQIQSFHPITGALTPIR